jgi:uncharacterized protein
VNPLHALLLFGVGTVAGTLNVIAGGGSLLTLPVLLFLGLPAPMANGTNRIALLAQNIVAVREFRRGGVLPLRTALLCVPSAMIGSAVGARIVLEISDALYQSLLGVVMILVCLVMVFDPARRLNFNAKQLSRARAGALVAAFFGIGIYGGIIQAGVGFLMMAVLLLQGMDLVRINAVKVFVVLFYTVTALAVFLWHGQVDWQLGLSLAAGNALGGWLGTRLTISKGHAWIRRLVLVVVVLFAVRLLWR